MGHVCTHKSVFYDLSLHEPKITYQNEIEEMAVASGH